MSVPIPWPSVRAKSSTQRNWQLPKQRVIRVLLLLSVLLAAQLTSCGRNLESTNASSVEAVPTPPAQPHKSGPAERRLPKTAPDPAERDPEPNPVLDSTSTPVAAVTSEEQTVARLLAEYSQAVTDLAAHPDTSSDPLSAQRLVWAGLVPAESSLFSDVLNQLVVVPSADKTRVIPAATGLSYSYRPLKVGFQAEGTIGFSWCGYSPGVRVAQDSEEVLDDSVAQLQGTGSVRKVGSSWMIDSLDHLDLVVHPPGAVDPCPTSTTSGGPK
jgi:hypothetical protein